MTSVTITPNRLTSSGLLDSVAGEDGSNRLPSYTPMYVLRLNEYANGQASPIFNWNTPIVSTERAGVDQSKSIRLRTRPSNPAVLCGTNNFAGRMNLAQNIPLGKTVWMRMKMFFPSEFSFGYSWAGNTVPTPADDGCPSVSNDGNPTGTKWLVFSPDVGTARAYLLAPNDFRQVNPAVGSGRVALEYNAVTTPISAAFPRDEWVTLELAMKVSNTGTGYLRAWMNGVLIGSLGGSTGTISTISPSATAVKDWGLGDYWNGSPWTDGAANRDTFYIDEVVVATDVDGYGAPEALDSNGYPMIGVDVKNKYFR